VVFTSVFEAQASKNLLQPDPDHPAWVYYQLGLYAQAVGNHHGALEYFSQAISFAPDMTRAYEARGDSYTALQLYGLAVADYTQALTLAPNDMDCYAKRAFAYAASGDLDAARRDFDQIAEPLPLN